MQPVGLCHGAKGVRASHPNYNRPPSNVGPDRWDRVPAHQRCNTYSKLIDYEHRSTRQIASMGLKGNYIRVKQVDAQMRCPVDKGGC